jgi:SWI/SNF-related matrix-associated actin-dependent regulator of chromatin subfamily A3
MALLTSSTLPLLLNLSLPQCFFRAVDKARVTLAMSLRRIDPADIPESARVKKPILASNHVSTSNAPKKRKAAQAGLGQASSSTNPTPTASASFPCPTQEDGEEEIVDELYCNLTTSVVGIQYYNGRNSFISSI